MNGLKIVILGLSITSSWGNGHATTYRALVKALARRGHQVLFLERDVPWYATQRDLPEPPLGRARLYRDLAELRRTSAAEVADADLVVVGSYVPDGVAVARWVLETARGVAAFYDIDTPVTLAKLARGDDEYLVPELIPRFDLYLSFTGGPVLNRLADEFGALRPRPLYCSVDPDVHRPGGEATRFDLGYMGTYSPDRQPGLEALLLTPARQLPAMRFTVAGPQYPADIAWPANVERIEHLPPARHAAFYGAQRFTLNLTRADMVRAGWSPSVRLFEAAAVGTPVISDAWPGLDAFFVPGSEILVAESSTQVVAYLEGLDESERLAIAAAAQHRVLASHTSTCRAVELEGYVDEVRRGARTCPSEALTAEAW